MEDQGAVAARHLLDLPEELRLSLLAHCAEDDYAMLTLPLVCHAFRCHCESATLAACRLASRLRQVADTLPPGQPDSDRFGWIVGHVWGALVQAQDFIEGSAEQRRRLPAFASAPHGTASLQTILSWCMALQAPEMPPARKDFICGFCSENAC